VRPLVTGTDGHEATSAQNDAVPRRDESSSGARVLPLRPNHAKSRVSTEPVWPRRDFGAFRWNLSGGGCQRQQQTFPGCSGGIGRLKYGRSPRSIAPRGRSGQTYPVDSIPAPSPSSSPSVAPDSERDPNYVPLSPEPLAMLERGIQSAKRYPEGVYRGSFAQLTEQLIEENRETLTELAR
jgi:hypothetical protein